MHSPIDLAWTRGGCCVSTTLMQLVGLAKPGTLCFRLFVASKPDCGSVQLPDFIICEDAQCPFEEEGQFSSDALRAQLRARG